MFFDPWTFASRKSGKHKKESFNATRWCLFTKTYINRFSGIFSKNKNTKNKYVESWIGNWDEISFRKVDLGCKSTSEFTHIHCWTRNHRFSHSRQHVDDEPSMCSNIQLTSVSSGMSSSSHSLSMRKVPIDAHFWKKYKENSLNLL